MLRHTHVCFWVWEYNDLRVERWAYWLGEDGTSCVISLPRCPENLFTARGGQGLGGKYKSWWLCPQQGKPGQGGPRFSQDRCVCVLGVAVIPSVIAVSCLTPLPSCLRFYLKKQKWETWKGRLLNPVCFGSWHEWTGLFLALTNTGAGPCQR